MDKSRLLRFIVRFFIFFIYNEKKCRCPYFLILYQAEILGICVLIWCFQIPRKSESEVFKFAEILETRCVQNARHRVAQQCKAKCKEMQ